MNVLEELMNNRWIVKAEEKEKYYRIKDKVGDVKKFLSDKLGYQIIVTPHMIKLEKIPGRAESWMGIEEFTDKLEYGFLCMVLMFLEDKETEEQFVLSQLTEYIAAKYESQPIDWTLYQNRRHLIKVIKFCVKNFMIKVDDGSEEGFMNNYEAEVLYENTGLSRYFMKNFSKDIMTYQSYSDFKDSEWIDINQDRGIARRQRIYRRIMMSVGVYPEGEADEDFLYIKQYRNVIENDLEQLIDCSLQIHKSSAYLVIGENSSLGKCFPENNNMSDIILLINQMIRKKEEAKEYTVNVDETILLSGVEFQKLVKECRNRYGSGFVKTYRDKTSTEFYLSVKNYMEFMEFINIDMDHTVIIKPVVGKLIGRYPESYQKEEAEIVEQQVGNL